MSTGETGLLPPYTASIMEFSNGKIEYAALSVWVLSNAEEDAFAVKG
jgi:hypothetical protein